VPPRSVRPTWIPELQGLRAVAALSVVLAHWSPLPLAPSAFSYYALVQPIRSVAAANLGVIFFYTLSAFLLTYLAVLERERTGRFAVGAFYTRRCFRIWPLYFTVLAVDLGAAATNVPGWGTPDWPWIKEHAWLWLSFLSNWSVSADGFAGYADRSTAPLRVLWSIGVEEQFYVLYPLVMLYIFGARYRAVTVAVAATAVAVIFRLAALSVPVAPGGGMYYATLTYLDVFAIGALSGALVANGGGRRWRTVLGRRGVGSGLLVVAVLLALRWPRELTYPYTPFSVVIYGLSGALFGVIILWLLVNRGALAARVLRSRPMTALGTLSFGLYMWHPLALPAAERMVSWLPSAIQAHDDLRTGSHLFLYLALVAAMSAASYALVEQPFLRVKDRLAGRRSSSIRR